MIMICIDLTCAEKLWLKATLIYSLVYSVISINIVGVRLPVAFIQNVFDTYITRIFVIKGIT